MGQFYYIVVGDKNGYNIEKITNAFRGFNYGMKLTEFSYWNNSFSNSVSQEIYNNPKRICCLGDYATDDDLEELNIQSFTIRDVWGIKEDKLSTLEKTNFTLDDKYLLNHTKKLYVDLNTYKKESNNENDNMILHPIMLLTAVGNDRGSGDFHDYTENVGYDNVGTWAWDEIELIDNTEKIPIDYTKLDLVFKESRDIVLYYID